MDWRNYAYLQTGTAAQRKAYTLLTDLNIFEIFSDFDPALVSTVCVNLHTEESDLDIICQLSDEAYFKSIVKHHFADQPEFRLWKRSGEAFITCFDTGLFPIEIYGSPRPVEQQYGWRHLSMMHRVLCIEPDMQGPVRELKRNGLSTEEAFARLLNLEGNPYEAFLSLEERSDSEIQQMAQVANK